MTKPRSFEPRPTVYNGIQMRSRLEAKIAATLDLIGCSWSYESNAYASSTGQYLPDFRVEDVLGGSFDHVFIEVRPTPERAREKWRHETTILWKSEPVPLLYAGMFNEKVWPLFGYLALPGRGELTLGILSSGEAWHLWFDADVEPWIEGWMSAWKTRA